MMGVKGLIMKNIITKVVLLCCLMAAQATAWADISGKVYQDFNANGKLDTGASFNEPGAAGVTVTAYAADGSQAATATSAADGAYTLTGLTAGVGYRLEFTWVGDWLKPGAAGGTSVQFAQDGATAVNASVNNAVNYCQTNPSVIIPVYNRTGTDPALVKVPYHGGTITTVANNSVIGAIWGLAYDINSQRTFMSALYDQRPERGYGPLGSGGIYVFNRGDNTTVPFLDLKTLGITTDGTNSPGKTSLGGIDTSDDGKTLYVMNLETRKLLAIDIASKSLLQEIPVTDPGCKAGQTAAPNDFRPWAVKVHEGKIYVGAVCSGETANATAAMRDYVLAWDGISWSVYYDMPPLSNVTNGSGRVPWHGSSYVDYSQQQLAMTDVDFNSDGSLLLSYMDRAGFFPSAAYSYGQMVRICDVNGSFVAEGGTGCKKPFYAQPHYEGGHGAVSIIPGLGESVSNLILGAGTEGLGWHQSTDGSLLASQVLPQGYNKANGMGDLELLCDAPPTEIGNRVWQDTDGDGIQDADEPGIAGVEVKLLAADGTTLLGTATTAADGTYYFSSASGTSTASTIYGITALQPGTAYTVQFPTTVTVGGTDYQLTTANAGSNRLIDSNAAASGIAPIGTTDIPVVGANNHSFDVGYTNVTSACTINATSVTSTCVNNGTPTNPADDRYVYRINATGTGVGSTYNISGGDTVSALSYGTAYSSTRTFPIYGARISLTLTDATNTSCTLADVAVPVPPPCSAATTTSDIAVTKVADKTNVKSGDTLRYTITAKNNGPSAAPGVELTDALPTGITYQTHNASKGTYDSATGIWAVGAMAIGETATLTIDVKAD